MSYYTADGKPPMLPDRKRAATRQELELLVASGGYAGLLECYA